MFGLTMEIYGIIFKAKYGPEKLRFWRLSTTSNLFLLFETFQSFTIID